MKKQCFKCGCEKPLSEFYRHFAMGDGYLGKCKECTKKDSRDHRQKNIEAVKQYDRVRGYSEKHREQVKAYRAGMSAEQRARGRFQKKAWAERNRIKRACHSLVGNAIKAGKIIKQPCERCGSENTHAHHEDYYKPFEITWLCPTCHGLRHRDINADNRVWP